MSSDAVSNPVAAMEAVVNTTELLENILSFLPIPRLLETSRVSRGWKTVIDASPNLQDRLFLPRKGQCKAVSPDHDFRWTVDNLWRLKLKSRQRKAYRSLASIPKYSIPIELNPLAEAMWQNQLDFYFPHEVTVQDPEPSICIPGLKVFLSKYSRVYAHHRFGAPTDTAQTKSAWRKMYLTMPRITDIVVYLPATIDTHANLMEVHIHAKKGITLGLLRDKVEETFNNLKKSKNQTMSLKNQCRRLGFNALAHTGLTTGWGQQENPMFLAVAGTATEPQQKRRRSTPQVVRRQQGSLTQHSKMDLRLWLSLLCGLILLCGLKLLFGYKERSDWSAVFGLHLVLYDQWEVSWRYAR